MLFLLQAMSSGCASILGSNDFRDEDACQTADASVVRDLQVHLRNLPVPAWSELRLLDAVAGDVLAMAALDLTSDHTSEITMTNAVPGGRATELEWFVDYDSNKSFDADADLLVKKQVCPDGTAFVSTNSDLPPQASATPMVGPDLRVTLLFDAGLRATYIDVRATNAENGQQVALYRVSNFQASPLIFSIPGPFELEQTIGVDVSVWQDTVFAPEIVVEETVTMVSSHQTLTLDARALN